LSEACDDDFIDTHGVCAACVVHLQLLDSTTFKVAQQNFVGSMAAYSMICFLLQVRVAFVLLFMNAQHC
jgi:hypothetical protein